MLLLVMPGMVLAEARGRAVVIDGDTLDVSGTEVRLSGIDAPELDQRCSTRGDVLNENSDTYPCGMEAAAALADRIGDDPVICDEPASGSQKPVVAVCWLNDEDLGAWLVRSGWARAYPLSISPYTLVEKEAQAALRGIWRGDFLDPWDWRKQQAGRTGVDRPKAGDRRRCGQCTIGALEGGSAPRNPSPRRGGGAVGQDRPMVPGQATGRQHRLDIRGPCPARPYPRTDRPVNPVKCGTLQMITLLHRDRACCKSV